jgi:hypothetical protein
MDRPQRKRTPVNTWEAKDFPAEELGKGWRFFETYADL